MDFKNEKIKLPDKAKFIWVSIGLFALAWILDSLMDPLVLHEGTIIGQIITPSNHEIITWLSFGFVFILFGIIIQFSVTRFKRAEDALKGAVRKAEDEKNKTKEIIEAIGDGIILQDTDYKIVYQNQIQTEIYGNRVGEYCYKAYEGKDSICEDCPVEMSLKDGKIHKTERKVPTDKGILYIELTGSPLKDSTGKIIGGVKVVRDMTERKRTEEALRQSEERFHSAIDHFPGIFCIYDRNLRFVYVNSEGTKTSGMMPEDYVGHTDEDLFPPEITKKFLPTLREARDSGKPQRIEVDLDLMADRHSLIIDYIPLMDKSRQVYEILGVAQNVTERKRMIEELRRAHDELELRVQERTSELAKANEALLESEASYRELTESIGEVFYALDRDLRYTYWNSASEALTGISAKDAVEKSLFELFPELKESRAEKLYTEVLKTQQPRHFVHRYRARDKDLFFEINAYPSKSGLSVIAKDITEHRHAEEALEKERDKAQRYFDIAGTALVVIGADQEVSQINKKGCEILGYEENEIVGKNWFDFFIPEGIRDNIKAVFNKLMAGEIEPVEFYENLVLTKSGEERLIAWHNSILKDETGGIIAILGSGEDITERRRAEEAVLARETQLLLILDNVTDIIFTIAVEQNDRFRFKSINRQFLEVTGLSENQVVGKLFQEVIPEPAHALVFGKYKEAIQNKQPARWEEVSVYPTGRKVGEVAVAPIFDIHGNCTQLIGIVHDITERKRAEEALKQSEEKYHKLIDNIQDGIFIIQNGKIQFANEAFARIAGYTVEEVIGKDIRELVAPEDSGMAMDRYYRRQAGEDVPHEYEFHMMHKDGKTRVLINMNVGLINYRGRVASMGTVKDITEKRRLESQLLLSQRLESIGTLAGGIAHDINNVLTPIMLSQQLLQERLTDEESQRLLNTIERSTQRGANLMKQVQSFAKGAKGERNVLQMAQIVSEIMEIAKETFPKFIEIRTDIPKDLLSISGDATQLNQVIMNLCVNARDAMINGGILKISAENLFIDEDYAHINTDAKIGPYIVVTISDTGTGIPPEILDRIFEPFYTTKEHGKGTGLGLSIALGIVKSHGGFITVDSKVGKGTAFKVYLPAITTTETIKEEEQQHELPAGHGESILVVDDEDQIREVTKKILETHGYKVITASDGKEAIALYSQHRELIKAVLMDMMMPVMDGATSIEELYKINPQLKIIAASGLTEADKFAKIADNSVYTFLIKPYTTEILLKTIHEILNVN